MEKAGRRLRLVAVPAAVLAMQVAAVSPLAQWSLDEGAGQVATDGSGNGHHAVLGTNPGPDSQDPSWVPGRIGSGLRFEGELNQFAAIAPSEDLAPQRVTVQSWVRRLGTPGAYRYVLSSGARGCDYAPYGLYSAANGGLAFYVSDQSGFVVSPDAAPRDVWDGQWHLAVGTYDGANVRLYLDGRQIGSGTPTELNIAYESSSGAYIGSYRGSCDLPFTGDVDEVSILDRALDSDEVARDARRHEDLPLPAQKPPVKGPPAGSQPGAGGGGGTQASCDRLVVTPKRIAAGRKSTLAVTVRRSKAGVAGVKISVRGFKVAKRARTGGRGRSRLSVKPRRRGNLRVRVVGAPRHCAPSLVKVSRRGR